MAKGETIIKDPGQKLKNLRENKNWSQRKVAEMLNISNSTLSKIENGNRMLDTVILNKFADIFQVSTDYIIRREIVKEVPDQPYAAKFPNNNYIPIPLFGEIKANPNGIAYYDHFLGYRMISKAEVSNGQFFYLKVCEDSMAEEGIQEGCIVLIKQQTTVEQGKIAVILINNGVAKLRRIFYQPNELIIIQSANHHIPPEIQPNSKVQILGQVVQFIKDL